ncbi:beta-ketoacyl-ACP synthase II [Salinibacter ruber]|jgi:3-oxoacyl-[acyl-carrier-protein] synthase II|uniref:3-oxoacyl-[acyl-carrier-protein] synthase 2 n=2 Tax=Salinibacter ruber TaxID=146919 RepID=A0A9X2QSV3_9BACT|nr:beta-ketoacyl-ACP synthase II [Salinibacter ruber]MCS3627643.1 3-oxoacyl-[acyl-carrier-protein] synthase II [Salinibacter ruber]MCS3640401.1 3-oxoacyl-[acyl-carrier-protein] synthase II [Salinibacter ruber]MCS3649760.1 3-oxoacyl-[acyl-carrier-protein] synthase II [Salinibacter ruber]MCS3653014.1 3-oxoacyl-[acyl-carrier-protein] synthase II [Salinibacter ruber]MCS3664336.1 3-oxoacyl-[acyl-carrier-protein] synthase II [Salinibacter ruber]
MAGTSRRVVVTGMGALTPLGLSVEEYWRGLVEGESGAATIESFDPEGLRVTFACELDGFDPEDHLPAKQARRVDPFSQYALVTADQAVADAGLDPDGMSQDEKDRIGVVYGTGIGGIKTFRDQAEEFIEGGEKRTSPFFIPTLIPDIAAGQIAMAHGFRGPNHAMVSACATGNHNIGDAYRMIQRGDMDAALCGGTDACVTRLGIAGFASMRALSTRNDDPARASRPFDAHRDGFVMGEGAGALFIEDLERARARGATIYAEIEGIGMSADAHHLTAPDPEGGGVCLALNRVLDNAGLEPTDVDYINAHGTSTPLGDEAETKALKKVFDDHAYDLNVSSTKSMTGHLLGAAGAIEAIAAIQALRHDVVPPTINFEEADPACDLDYTFNEAEERPVSVALSNAFGFGGHNTSLALRAYDE